MLIVPPPQRVLPSRRRGNKRPVGLVLTSAVFHHGGISSVYLTFDRAVNIVATDPTAVQVADGVFAMALYQGNGVTFIAANQIRVLLTSIGSAPAGVSTLTATSASNVAAVDDGGTWIGVNNLVLPFTG